MTSFIGYFCVGGASAQLFNAMFSQAHPEQELRYLTVAIYLVAASICFKKVTA